MFGTFSHVKLGLTRLMVTHKDDLYGDDSLRRAKPQNSPLFGVTTDLASILCLTLTVSQRSQVCIEATYLSFSHHQLTFFSASPNDEPRSANRFIMLSLANSWLLLSALPLLVRADISYQPCPLLGPRLPMPTALATSETMHAALGNLTKTFDEIVSTGNSSYGQVSPNTTSFSVALFSTHDLGNASEPFIYQYHYTALSLAVDIYGNRKVDSNTIYNIGGLTQMLTVYAFLICAGDYHWQQPITKYLPELASSSHLQHLESIQWEDVQLKDLASHMAGIPRDGKHLPIFCAKGCADCL